MFIDSIFQFSQFLNFYHSMGNFFGRRRRDTQPTQCSDPPQEPETTSYEEHEPEPAPPSEPEPQLDPQHHPHTSLSLPVIEALPLTPIIFTHVHDIDGILSKLYSLIQSAENWPENIDSKEDIERILVRRISPYFKSRFSSTPPSEAAPSESMLVAWNQVTLTLVDALPMDHLYPLIDLWRLAILDQTIGEWASALSPPDPISVITARLTEALRLSDASTTSQGMRNFMLTGMRFLSNAIASPALCNQRLLLPEMKFAITSVLTCSLLHTDPLVRTAAASLAFNFSATMQQGRLDQVQGRGEGSPQVASTAEDEDWEAELVSSVVKAIHMEISCEEVVHRLTASLAFLVRLSPFYSTRILPLLKETEVRWILLRKLELDPATGNGFSKNGGITRKEVRAFVEEVALKLCP